MRHPLNRQYFNASRVSLAVSALLLAQSALAQDFIKGGQDTFTFNVGGIVNRFDTHVAVDGATSTPPSRTSMANIDGGQQDL